jgi:hypothetical protein
MYIFFSVQNGAVGWARTKICSLLLFMPHFVSDCPSAACNVVSFTDHQDPEYPQSCADQVSLSKIETSLTSDTLTQCGQLQAW